MLKFLVKKLLRPKWVVFHTSDGDELGLKIWGVVIAYYSGRTYYPGLGRTYYPDFNAPDTSKVLREPTKHEFGESIHPINLNALIERLDAVLKLRGLSRDGSL